MKSVFIFFPNSIFCLIFQDSVLIVVLDSFLMVKLDVINQKACLIN